MKPKCGKGYSNTYYRCDLYSGHTGSHNDSRYNYKWPAAQTYHWIVDEAEPASYEGPDPEETSVLLTLEDLKVIAYYLPSDGNDDDAPTVAKIEEALKEML